MFFDLVQELKPVVPKEINIMVLIKSKPESFLTESFFPHSFNSFFNSFDRHQGHQNLSFVPQSDILEREKEFEIRLSLPGVKKEDVKISLEGDRLNIEGERKSEHTEEGVKFVRKEVSYGKFSRSFNIGKADGSKIDAVFSDGILSIRLPKSDEEKSSTIVIR